eukprot:TRINITY_DN75563_c0_g1_i1.p1 TRINITY_DN75563_c0_g1~~TRINITY_DN75563_c0_g1_i1.p1  ORF type:complete len:118 (+),score=33.85 TRINITY_DN75563_c0_g1_i1:62-415(+)
MSSSVGDEAELRKRKTQKEADEKEALRRKESNQDENHEPTPEEQEYIDYFRKRFGENPRTDILGIDGCGLFCLIYIVVAGVIFTIIFMSVYARQRDIFHKFPGFGGGSFGSGGIGSK